MQIFVERMSSFHIILLHAAVKFSRNLSFCLVERTLVIFHFILKQILFVTGQVLSEIKFVEEGIDMTYPFTLHLSSSFKAHVRVRILQVKFKVPFQRE